MNRLELLLPFGLPPTEMAPDLIRALKAPSLSLLLARANPGEREQFDGFSRALPHEQWLARRFGLTAGLDGENSPPVASTAMQAMNLGPQDGYWFILQPVHLHIARDHLVLTAPNQIALPEQDSRALFDTARPLFEEAGHSLVYGDARTWFLRADGWQQLHTATPDAAVGHNIDIWMPKGPTERDWRRLQNEVQMHWHAHAINEAREMAGHKPVNSVWLWGGADTTAQPAANKPALLSAGGGTSLFAMPPPRSVANAAQLPSEPAVLLLPGLNEPAMAGDWSAWLDAMHRIEAEWLAPLLTRLQSGEFASLSTVFTNNTGLATFEAGKRTLQKFWVRPSLSKLLS